MADLFLVDPAVPATSVVPPLPDAAERARALDIQHSWIVEAPAGSGKTGLLIQRYIKLLADESVASPEQVLAITFTKKATAEMRERVLGQLQSAAKGDEPANAFDRATRPIAQAALTRSRALGWQLLDQPQRLNIRSIDSVCSEIANSLPVLSGSGGSRSVTDDAAPLYATAARRTFMQLGASDTSLNSALRAVLLHRDGDLANCERLLADMLERRDQWGELVPLGRRELDDAYLDTTVLPKLERTLEQAICAALTQLAQIIPASVLGELAAAAASMAQLDGYKGQVSPIAICVNKSIPPGALTEDLDHWQALIHLILTPSSQSWRKNFYANIVRFELSKPEQDRLKSIVNQLRHRDDLLDAICKLGTLPPVRYPLDQWFIAKALFRVLNRAMAELQLLFAERSECDFTEVALAAKTALRSDEGPHDLEAALGSKLQHILVDEMQDTSSSQYELIQMLTAHFDGHSQTAFLVGDPKQSIYLFRQARVERFLRSMTSEQLGELPVGHLRLTANFRSQTRLVGEFNDDFSQIFPRPREPQHTHSADQEVVFVAASAMRPEAHSPIAGRLWHASVQPYLPTGTKTMDKKNQEMATACAIREIIAGWRARPLPVSRTKPWTIAILVGSRNNLREIVPELKDDSSGPPIPFRAVDIEPLRERPEVLDLFALTRALLHPADRTAWLAVLHAPWCGFGLHELYTLTGADDPAFARRTIRSLIEERGDLLPAEAILRLERVWPVFEAASALRSRAPLSQIVERTWRSLGGDAYCSPNELANAHRYLKLLDKVEEQQAGFDIATLEARMDKLYAAPLVDANAIDIMTIHKAKGLEWDVVIVPALERRAGSNRAPLLNWIELDAPDEASAHFLVAPIDSKGGSSGQLNGWIKSIRNAREAAERKRLFYVACTRAREELHLFAAPALSSKGDLKPKAGTLLEAAWPCAEAFFAAAIAESVPQKLSDSIASLPSADRPNDEALAIAASATESELAAERPAMLKRLPITFDLTERFTNPKPLPYGTRDEAPSAAHFERPEGSVAARAFGNAFHAFIERITQQLAARDSAASIVAALSGWTPRIAAILRSEGLQPALVERLTQRVVHALESTLKDPIGLWILSPHEGAATEYALTSWSAQRSNIRVDRIFRAGAEPMAAGQTDLWIVDYKTTTHGAEGLDAFLAQERAKYEAQLEAYAEALRQAEGEPAVRLALYYPMLSKLVWWPLA